MKVHWTETAEGHLDAIYAFIAQDSPQYAMRMVDRLTRRSQQIAVFPLSGRKVPEYEMDQIREVIEGPYPHHLSHQTTPNRRLGRHPCLPGYSSPRRIRKLPLRTIGQLKLVF
jgi:plasmid stabilization system protein ParE